MNKTWFWTTLFAIASFLIVLFLLLPQLFSNRLDPKPLAPIPNQSQLDWQGLEYYMFIHFGPNTFTNVEWGDGKENPKVFNPSDLDTRQWAAVAKDAGMKGIIITAKHHDGFCLWPSEYSTHTVRESLWKDGKGDLLRELSEACKEYGLKFGVYLSPWDQNHPAYGTAEYNEVFSKTLTEVLTDYGDVFEQWFDGAKGGDREQIYNWNLFHKTVYTHQPNAVIFSDIGPDIRWIGNERGFAGETNWSKIDTTGYGPGSDAPSQEILNTGLPNGEAWIAGEVDVSIRPGWFYSPETDDKVKSVEELMKIYYASVGRNANLLLNVPPDRRGRIHPNDSTRLMEFKRARELEFSENLMNEKTLIKASNTRANNERFAVQNLLIKDDDRYWATDDSVSIASIELDFGKKIELNNIVLQEYIQLGQRVSSFNIEYLNGTNWGKLAEGTTIGYKRIMRFSTISAQKIRININAVLEAPILLTKIEVYRSPDRLEAPNIIRLGENLSIYSDDKAIDVYYTLDGTTPTVNSRKAEKSIKFKNGGTVKAIAVKESMCSELVTRVYDIAIDFVHMTSEMMISSEFGINTMILNKNQSISLDMRRIYSLKGFSLTPVANDQIYRVNIAGGSTQQGIDDGYANKIANLYRYSFYVKQKEEDKWIKVMDNASFDNIKNNPIQQNLRFGKTYDARYLKLEPIELTDTKAGRYILLDIAPITR